MGRKEMVAEKLKQLAEEAKEDELRLLELTPELIGIYRRWRSEAVSLGFDPGSPEDFVEEVRRLLLEIGPDGRSPYFGGE
jgi:hypothetical protein